MNTYREFLKEKKKQIEVKWLPGNPISHLLPVSGVYIIFQHIFLPSEPLKIHIVYVGQSKDDAFERAKDHLTEEDFINRKYSDIPLRVIWAEIQDQTTRNGAEEWLAEKHNPKIGERHPIEDPPVEVIPNPPFLDGGFLLKDQ